MISQTDIDDFRDEPVQEKAAETRPTPAWLEWAAYTCWAYGFGLAAEAMLSACYPVDGTNGERPE